MYLKYYSTDGILPIRNSIWASWEFRCFSTFFTSFSFLFRACSSSFSFLFEEIARHSLTLITPPFWATFPLRLARFACEEVASWKAFRCYSVNSNLWVVAIDPRINLWICSGSIFSPDFNLTYALCNFSSYFTTEMGPLGIRWWKNRGERDEIQYSAAYRWACFS